MTPEARCRRVKLEVSGILPSALSSSLMSVTHRLASAFIPTRVAVVGASDREGSRGRAVWSGVMNSRRVLEAYPVNPKYKYIGLTHCWAGLRDLQHTQEL